MKEKKREKRQRRFEEKKRRIDAKARTIIRSTIDAKAFERSTYDCKTAYQLWEALKPGEAYTEEEIHRSLTRVRMEMCTNEMELLERMYEVTNKAAIAVPDKREQYETQAVKEALLNLKQPTHKFRFMELLFHMTDDNTPQTVSEFEKQFMKIIKEEKEVEQHNRHNQSSRQAA